MKQRRATRARPPLSGGWWAGLCCGALLLLSPGLSLMLGALLLPGLVVLLAAGRQHPTARAMLLFGLAGSVSALSRLLGGGAAAGMALRLLGEHTVVAEAWAAAGIGWLVTEAAAAAIATTWLLRDGIRKREIDREIAAIEAEWGSFR